jgi:hypothetical protein
MSTTAVEQSAAFGLRTLPVFFELQQEGFGRFQKLTKLNLVALKEMLDEGQAVFSPSQSGQLPLACAVGLAQQFFERSRSYAEDVRQIDSEFMASVTKAGEDLRNQYNEIWTQVAVNLGRTTLVDDAGNSQTRGRQSHAGQRKA